jgi:hypothetical protein
LFLFSLNLEKRKANIYGASFLVFVSKKLRRAPGPLLNNEAKVHDFAAKSTSLAFSHYEKLGVIIISKVAERMGDRAH